MKKITLSTRGLPTSRKWGKGLERNRTVPTLLFKHSDFQLKDLILNVVGPFRGVPTSILIGELLRAFRSADFHGGKGQAILGVEANDLRSGDDICFFHDFNVGLEVDNFLVAYNDDALGVLVHAASGEVVSRSVCRQFGSYVVQTGGSTEVEAQAVGL